MMKPFPFKVLFLCIFLPPILYVLIIQGLEGYLRSREVSLLDGILIQNQEALFEGRYSVQEEVSRNIAEYIGHSLKYALGIRINILVKTWDNRILYTSQFNNESADLGKEGEFSSLPRESLNYMEVAADNFKILNEGLSITADVRVKHNGWLSNSILGFLVLASALTLMRFVRKGLNEAERLEKEQEARIKDLSGQLEDMGGRLKDVNAKEEAYHKRISALKEDKRDLSKDIDGLLEELEKLESGLENQRLLKEKMELDVLELKRQLDDIKAKREKPQHKKKKKEVIHKRFKVLYKNLEFSERAVEGFTSLTDEFQLKAEEIIHRLNEDETMISVKRKVFGRGGKLNVLEADFSYSGRIYFQRNSKFKIRVLAIGTKNTQEKDIAYLESLK